MSKAVLISIQPKWCELIANGKKTVEVRKSIPKLETPFKAYIYCTKGTNLQFWTGKRYSYADDHSHNAFDKCGNGKVIGEFVCDTVNAFSVFDNGSVQDFYFDKLQNSCLSYGAISKYIGINKVGYSWHISDLKIYDRPKELSEFKVKRPPQSWQYVEECKDNE